MANISSRSFCASVAITAVLALGSTSALAQEAAPSLDLPQTVTVPTTSAPATTPTAPAPVVVPPAPTASVPVAPTTAPPATTTPTRPTIVLPDVTSTSTAEPAPRAATRSAPAPRAEAPPRTSPAPQAAAPTISEQQTSADAPVAPESPVIGDTLNDQPAAQADTAAPAPVQAESAPPAEDGDGLPVGAIAGVLALLALGAGGAAAMRSRRKSRPYELSPGDAVEPQARRERVIPQPAPVVAPAGATTAPAAEVTYSYAPATQTTYAPAADTTYAPVVAPAAKARSEAATPQQSFAMPEGPVPTGEARQQLLRDMVAAAPDKANPFRSPSYRRKRARVILQHRDFLQRSKDDQFDWRTYRPSTRPSTPVKPSLVDA